jgi:gas vesicle protein
MVKKGEAMADSQDRFYSGLAIGALLGGLTGGLLGYLLSAPSPESVSRSAEASRRIRRARRKNYSSSADPQVVLEEVQQSADQAISDARQSINVKIAQLNDAIEQARDKLGPSNHTKIREESSSPEENR